MIGDDSLAPSGTSSPLKAVVAGALVVALAAGAWWTFGRGTGQAEHTGRVLVVGPTPELGDFLENEGFEVTHLSPPEAIGEGQRFDASLDTLPAMLEYADQSGIAYLALNMSHGEQYDFAGAGYDGGESPPPGTTFAVLSVGDLGNTLHFGGVEPAVDHIKPAGEKLGLLLGLFEHEDISKARTLEADNDLMIRFGSADTVKHVTDYEKGQENMRRQVESWQATLSAEQGEPVPVPLGQAYEPLRAWPLANGSLLIASGHGAWRSSDGRKTSWEDSELKADLYVVRPDAPEVREPCTSLPDTLALDGGFAVAPAGDALLIPSSRNIAHLWVLEGEGCAFEKRDQIRRLYGRVLGQPRASGRTAASHEGLLNWADAKMRDHRQLRLAGVSLHEGELHWAGEETVIVPASVDFVEAVRVHEDPEAPPAAAPAALPLNREALLIATLPPPLTKDELRGTLLPVEALLPAPSQAAPEQLSIQDVFPLPSTETEHQLVVLIDGPDGSQLVRVGVPIELARRHNLFAEDLDLAELVQLPAGALDSSLLTDKLPHGAHELTIAPTGTLAAWSAPADTGDASEAFEIFTLVLGEAAAQPVRATHNSVADSHPRFVGAGEQHLVFTSLINGAEKLPAVLTVRMLSR